MTIHGSLLSPKSPRVFFVLATLVERQKFVRLANHDAQILSNSSDYVKFRTKDGQVIEQHSNYSSQTRPHTPSDH